MDSYYLTLLLYIFLIYCFIVFVLDRRGILQRYNITAYGPILMIRTLRGQKLLELMAKGERREKFWRLYANLGTILVFIAMTFMLILILYGAYGTFMKHPVPTELNTPRNWLLIPGLNQFIPMCAWVGFVVALVVHEFSHAVLSTVEKIKVKSMGLLVAVVPIGAFAEPDSEQLFGVKGEKEHIKKREEHESEPDREEGGGEKKKVATARERTRILSAGVTANFCVALIAFILFFGILSSIQPVSNTVLYVYGVADGSPGEKAGITSETFVLKVNGSKPEGVAGLDKALEGGGEKSLTVLDKKGKEREITVHDSSEQEGVTIVWVEGDTPASNAGIKSGMSITTMDNMSINTYDGFFEFMNHTIPGQEIEVQTEKREIFTVVLKESPYFDNKGYLGVRIANTPFGMTVVEFPVKGYLNYLRGVPSTLRSPYGWLMLMIIPVLSLDSGGFSSFNPLLAHFYAPVGAVSFFGGSIFFIADILFWIGWINFYVGLFNCLPAIPLDGGYVFKEMLNSVLGIGIKNKRRREIILMVIVIIMAIIIFLAILFMLVGPRIFQYLPQG
ncbi:MAG: site-2 protease family protein [Halobacteriota archaeon]